MTGTALGRMANKCLACLLAAVVTFAVAACGSSVDGEGRNPDGTVTISLAGWTLATRPEFQALAQAFESTHPGVHVDVKEYSADDYDTQLIADLSAGKAPDVFPIKNLKMYDTYATSGVLADLTDEARTFEGDSHISSVDDYRIDGSTYALPYRQDAWLLYYNTTMLSRAGIAIPDGSWTWEDYLRICRELKTALPDAGYPDAYPTYHHTSMQSLPQSIALAQQSARIGGAAAQADMFFSGDYGYLSPMYRLFLQAQDEGLTINYNTVSSSHTTYQSQFGTQKAALLLMGSWFMGPLADQQRSGEADDFEWGVAAMPQLSTSTAAHPVTFGDPTGFAISAKSAGAKIKAARQFVAWAAGKEGAKVTAATGSVPAYMSDDVFDVFFSKQSLPHDSQSRSVIQRSVIEPENPVGEATQVIQDELLIAQSSILSETTTTDQAVGKAEHAIANTGLLPAQSSGGNDGE